jgi:hypothetical protein
MLRGDNLAPLDICGGPREARDEPEGLFYGAFLLAVANGCTSIDMAAMAIA